MLHILEHVRVISMCRNDLAGSEDDCFDENFASRHVGKNSSDQRCLFAT
jgi:hypothetical protein